MKNLFKNEMERALKNKGMIIALCVSMAIILLDIYQNAIGVRLHMSEYQKHMNIRHRVYITDG